MQLYFDFSGYCDMAIGIALMFNIELPVNFNSPYKSTNIQEFWKKWHITLGRFLTECLYIPLGGNRDGEKKTLRNLFIVFLISGIWHGAEWTFVLWGICHGIVILIHRVSKSRGCKMNKILGWVLTFNLVNFLWILFRAPSIVIAIKIITKMFIFKDFNIETTRVYFENVKIITNSLGNYENLLIFPLSVVLIFFFQNSIEKKIILKEIIRVVLRLYYT